LVQPALNPMRIENQILSIYSGVNGYLDEIPLEAIHSYENDLHTFTDKSELFEETKRSLRYHLDKSSLNKFLRNFTKHFKNTILNNNSK
jgi:F-type H+/Na+-transporting ATPase subunit alpha